MWVETEVNHALVESTRPEIYRAIKYWGKKPHNIWRELIESYCPPGGLVLDPFAGSAISAIEAVRAGRKAAAFDLNPLSSFMIEVYASSFNENEFRQAVQNILDEVGALQNYKENYTFRFREKEWIVKNFHRKDGLVEKVAAECVNGKREVIEAGVFPSDRILNPRPIKISSWHPSGDLPRHPSINTNFLMRAGGDKISYLWTNRNLFVLTEIFSRIENVNNRSLKLQLLATFIQALHLCSRMVVPRNPNSNRDFSGSWGRPDYMIRNRELEQNPLDVFRRASFGRQGTLKMMKDRDAAFPSGISIHDAVAGGGIRKSADINYGILDVTDLSDVLGDNRADFSITDPPYAGLVRYLPLSSLWLAWLSKIDRKYVPRLQDELTLFDSSDASRQQYRRKLRSAIEQIYKTTYDNSKLILTFHHQDVSEFNELINAIHLSGFIIDKVTHQYNRRSGESNVANPYGVSGSDFYIRCVKHRKVDFSRQEEDLERFILVTAERIIASRNEPTPYDLLFQSLWPELIQAGFVSPTDSHTEVRRVLKKFRGGGGPFVTLPGEDQSGELWWFAKPKQHIRFPDRPLASRVEDSIRKYLRRNVAAKLDDILAHVFQEYPNGLTPNPRKIPDLLDEIATKSGGKWRIKPEALAQATQHTQVIKKILDLNRDSTKAYVGKREQYEATTSGLPLSHFADLPDLRDLGLTDEARSRLEMVDVAFVNQGKLECIWEVENSTTFMSAIQRGSNAAPTVPKIMVIPDDREDELKRISDPLFKLSFREQGWKFLTYRDLRRAKGFSGTWQDVCSFAKDC